MSDGPVDCRTCRWHRESASYHWSDRALCAHPGVVTRADPMTHLGQTEGRITNYPRCRTIRASGNPCGPDASLYEPTPRLSVLRRHPVISVAVALAVLALALSGLSVLARILEF